MVAECVAQRDRPLRKLTFSVRAAPRRVLLCALEREQRRPRRVHVEDARRRPWDHVAASLQKAKTRISRKRGWSLVAGVFPATLPIRRRDFVWVKDQKETVEIEGRERRRPTFEDERARLGTYQERVSSLIRLLLSPAGLDNVSPSYRPGKRLSERRFG